MARRSRKTTETEAAPEPRQAVSRLGGYVRLSSADRKQKGNSIENQQAIINAYMDEHPELELAGMYIDDGATGQNFDRPAFQRMLADLESGAISGCISKDLSRLGRNSIDTGYYIEHHFPARGYRYIAINDGYDSADSRSGGVMVALKNLINESYAIEVGRKVSATRQMNIANGCFVGGFAPYGYLKDPADGHRLVPDPYAAAVVRSVFEMYVGGVGVVAIRDHLNKSGVMPPNLYRHTNDGNAGKAAASTTLWKSEGICGLLGNRMYCGDMVQGRSATKQYEVTLRKPSELVITRDTHEPIVSRELFDAAQARKPKTRAARWNAQTDIFAKKLYCGHCGYAVRREAKKKSRYGAYYFCPTRKSCGKDTCARVPVSINEAELKSAVFETLRKQAEVFIGDGGGADTGARAAGDGGLRAVRAEIDRAVGFLNGLYESLSAGDITPGEYREMKTAYETKIAGLTERESGLREEARLASLESARRGKAASGYGALRTADGLTAEVVDALIGRILLFQGKRIEIAFKYADATATAGGDGND